MIILLLSDCSTFIYNGRRPIQHPMPSMVYVRSSIEKVVVLYCLLVYILFWWEMAKFVKICMCIIIFPLENSILKIKCFSKCLENSILFVNSILQIKCFSKCSFWLKWHPCSSLIYNISLFFLLLYLCYNSLWNLMKCTSHHSYDKLLRSNKNIKTMNLL